MIAALVLAVATVTAPAEAFIERTYHAVLGRAPDDQGLAFWSERIDQVGTERVVIEILASPEAADADLTVDALYDRVLGRRPGDAAAGWSTVGDAERVHGIVTSPEALAAWGHEPVGPPGWVDLGHGVFGPEVLASIRWCESRDDYTAANPRSSARGAYQFLRSSWADHGHAATYGVTSADQASPAEQDEAAVTTWERWGTSPWAPSARCWR